MSEEKTSEEISQVEFELQLPKILNGPIELEDGTLLAVGDLVEHARLGKGTIVRLSNSDRVGNLVYIEFESGVDKILGASFVRKVSK